MQFRYLCPLCVHVERADAVSICSRCEREHRELVRLYTEIVSRYPKLKSRTIAEVFRAMWEKVNAAKDGR